MSFRRAARAALTGIPWVLAVLVLAAFSVSCVGGGTHRSPVDPNHSAYVTLPETGAVLQLHIDGATGKRVWPEVMPVSRWPWRIESGRSTS